MRRKQAEAMQKKEATLRKQAEAKQKEEASQRKQSESELKQSNDIIEKMRNGFSYEEALGMCKS